MNINHFIARWSRSGNLLCHGQWQITYEGHPFVLPQNKQDDDMGTYDIYDIMDPDNELFADGLKEDDWILANIDWLADCFADNGVPVEEPLIREFYQAVNRSDWRCTSCAGCM